MYIVYTGSIYSGGEGKWEKKSNLTRPGEIVDLSIANDNKKKTPLNNRKRPDNNTATINNSTLVARTYIIIDAVCGSAAERVVGSNEAAITHDDESFVTKHSSSISATTIARQYSTIII